MLRLFVIIPFIGVLVVLMLINDDPVVVKFLVTEWKTSIGLFALVLGFVSFLIGALTVLISLISQWSRARKAEQKSRELEKQLSDLQTRYIDLTSQQGGSSTIIQPDYHSTFTPSHLSVEDLSQENKKDGL